MEASNNLTPLQCRARQQQTKIQLQGWIFLNTSQRSAVFKETAVKFLPPSPISRRPSDFPESYLILEIGNNLSVKEKEENTGKPK